MPPTPLVADRPTSALAKTNRVGVHNDQPSPSRPLRPGHDPCVDGLVAKAVADDDEGVSVLKSFVKPEMLVGINPV